MRNLFFRLCVYTKKHMCVFMCTLYIHSSQFTTPGPIIHPLRLWILLIDQSRALNCSVPLTGFNFQDARSWKIFKQCDTGRKGRGEMAIVLSALAVPHRHQFNRILLKAKSCQTLSSMAEVYVWIRFSPQLQRLMMEEMDLSREKYMKIFECFRYQRNHLIGNNFLEEAYTAIRSSDNWG